MSIWERMRRTGQRPAKVFVLREIPSGNGIPAEPGALIPGQDYFRIWLSEMFLGTRSTLTADWLPAAHAQVTMTRVGAPAAEWSKVLRPDREDLAQGVRLNYPLTDLVPYSGGVVEVEAALLAWRQTSRVEAALHVLQAVSALPIPALSPALAIAGQVTAAARTLVQQADGAVHLTLHQSFVAAAGQHPQAASVLRPGYLAALLADETEVAPAGLRVVDSRLHQDDQDGTVAHLRGWDYLLLQIEGRSQLDDWRLPEIDDLLIRAREAASAGQRSFVSHYRDAAVATIWRSPLFNWADRDRIIITLKAMFDDIQQHGTGVVPRPRSASLAEHVRQYGPSLEEIRARGAMTEASAFA